MSVEAASCRRTKTSSKSAAALEPSFFHPEVFEHEQVDARELLDEIASRARGIGLGEIGRLDLVLGNRDDQPLHIPSNLNRKFGLPAVAREARLRQGYGGQPLNGSCAEVGGAARI
jgi:hypothetical protein